MGCEKSFEGKGKKFCDNVCRDSHMAKLEERMWEAVKNDPSHTKELSKDE